MDDVAKELSLSKKTIYQFVKDKTELVDLVIDYLGSNSQIRKHCGDDDGLNAIEKQIKVYKMITAMLMNTNPSFEYDLQKYYAKQFAKLIQKRRNEMFNKMKTDLEQGIEEGYYRSNLNLDKAAVLQMIRIEGFKDNDIFEKYNFTKLDLLEDFFRFQVYSIATPKGIDEYERLMKKTNLDQ
jgi:AcrR family transcriptional regulator